MTLSPRQRQIVDLLIAGHAQKSIADELKIKPCTVKTYLARLRLTLGAASMVQAIALYCSLRATSKPVRRKVDTKRRR